MFKGTELGEATLNGAAISSMVTYHNTYTEVTNSPQYGTCKDSYIEGQQLVMMLLGINMVLVLVPNS